MKKLRWTKMNGNHSQAWTPWGNYDMIAGILWFGGAEITSLLLMPVGVTLKEVAQDHYEKEVTRVLDWIFEEESA